MSNMTMEKLLEAIKLVEKSPKPISNRLFIDDNVCLQRERIQIRFPKRKCHRLRKRFAKYEKTGALERKKFVTKPSLVT